jgi:hypothetical protein
MSFCRPCVARYCTAGVKGIISALEKKTGTSMSNDFWDHRLVQRGEVTGGVGDFRLAKGLQQVRIE